MKIAEKNKEAALFKIKELVERTGVTRETIHFYLAEGLLQQPAQKSKNMSWYSKEHIERLNIIKELQEKQFLPLKAIKSILNNNVGEFNFTQEQQELIESVKNKVNKENDVYSLNKVAKTNKISKTHLKQMVDIGYINKISNDSITFEDKILIESWTKLENLGINNQTGFEIKDLEMFKDIVEILFNQEFQKLTEKLANLSGNQIIDIIENSIPVINEIIASLHQKKVKQFIYDFKSNI